MVIDGGNENLKAAGKHSWLSNLRQGRGAGAARRSSSPPVAQDPRGSPLSGRGPRLLGGGGVAGCRRPPASATRRCRSAKVFPGGAKGSAPSVAPVADAELLRSGRFLSPQSGGLRARPGKPRDCSLPGSGPAPSRRPWPPRPPAPPPARAQPALTGTASRRGGWGPLLPAASPGRLRARGGAGGAARPSLRLPALPRGRGEARRGRQREASAADPGPAGAPGSRGGPPRGVGGKGEPRAAAGALLLLSAATGVLKCAAPPPPS